MMPDFRSIGPLYCETPHHHEVTADSALALFPLELINTYTSLVPSLFGIAALWYLYTHRQLLSPVVITAAATIVVGVGSALWHGLRTPLTLTLDVVPGLVAFLSVVYLWPRYVLGVRGAVTTFVLLFGGVFLASWVVGGGVSDGPPPTLFVVTALVAGWLIYVTYRRHGSRLAALAGAMILSAIIAATARTIDLYTCHLIPVGTHFIWHLCLGLAAYLAVVLLSKLARASEN